MTTEVRFKYTNKRGKKQDFLIPNTITGLTNIVEREFDIADATTLVFWDPLATTTDVMQDYDFLAVITDGDVFLERIVDDGSEVGKVVYAEKITKDIPYMSCNDDAFANVGADDAFSGTADLIERLGIRNDSGSTRSVMVIMAT